ncbi:MAG: VanZ family protein [Planctomycetota bacterium]
MTPDSNGSPALALQRAGPGLGVLRRFGAFLAGLPRGFGVVAAAAWMGFLWWLSSDTRDAGLNLGLGGFVPNLGHAPLYATLAVCWLIAWPRERPAHLGARPWARLPLASAAALVALPVAYGAIDEWHQASVPGRDASPADLLTDLAGAGATVLIARYAGSAAATERGLWKRLGLGVLACLAAAGLATLD